MSIKPILMGTPMAEALAAGRKTQTRRTKGLEEINKDPDNWQFKNQAGSEFYFYQRNLKRNIIYLSPKYTEGDIIWVRETWKKSLDIHHMFLYRADSKNNPNIYGYHKWKPSIYMPKEACRKFLEVTDVRVERLQDISEEDAIAEGVLSAECESNSSCISSLCKLGCVGKGTYHIYPIGDHFEDFPAESPEESFQSLWQSINSKKQPWESNPWVWVYEFKEVERPINFLD
ncbi:hypothetical protein JM79_3206 [Gramella sp. Hel_I_59]|uniref:hypothetical protein n=1 Tax=Gramella sp. Hel_I_59 TaxID=1249978 RepID=UPI00114E4FBC|nr:hypothetical protein [Gramella sp. Hel_I_59]TQI72249.1 hypothetical protein JM79_3206 [Gramella sp. Hel_I_59]